MPRPITIVIASYNRQHLIGATLKSCLEQTSAAAEILVVDDGSKDDTVAYLRREFPGVRVHPLVKNQGQSAARNAGMVAASNDLVLFLDSDDALHPHAIETVARIFDELPGVGAVFTDHCLDDRRQGTFISSHHDTLPQFARLKPIVSSATAGKARRYEAGTIYRTLLFGNLLQQPWLCRREVFREVGGFNTQLKANEDWDLFLRITRRYPIALSDEVISTHIISAGQAHVSLSNVQDTTNTAILEETLASHALGDLYAQRVIRRRLGNYYKTQGDHAHFAQKGRGLPYYWRSFRYWPFDEVVVARLVMWSAARLARRA